MGILSYDPFEKSNADIVAEDAALQARVDEARAAGSLDEATVEVMLALHRRLGEYWRWTKERR